MAAQALYLKYRPLVFEEVVGQEPVTRTLRNALRQGKIRHAYLFTGPRGTGKTTTARLLAKAVNCLAAEELRPCNTCANCIAVNQGRFLDLIEIDAASNRGIDEIRDIREKVGFRPNEGRYKVYVLDEAHMLTEPAFNALLKTLEEPPPHVIFALVTTEPHKIPATISSRCQRFDLGRVPLQAIVGRLATVASREGLKVEPSALDLIARAGTGAVRDAISLLDQLTSYGDEISLTQVQLVLGTVAGQAAASLVACLADGDAAGGLNLINRALGEGADPRQLGREIVEYLRGLLLIREGAGTALLNATAEQATEMESTASRMSVEQLLRAIRLFSEATTDLKRGLQTVPQLGLEVALVESLLGHASALDEPAAPASLRERPPLLLAKPALQPEEAAAPSAGEPVSPTPLGAIREPVTQLCASLEQVRMAWPRVLEAVRVRNPTTVAALNTGCKPVEVNGTEIIVTFPYPVLREKLSTPQRRMEIQNALSEVLGLECYVTLMLSSDYVPRAPEQGTAEGAAAADKPVPGASSSPTPDETALDQIARWAQERGGQARVVQP